MHQPPLFYIISQSLLRLMSMESVMPSNDLILCRPLLLLSSIFPSIRVFSNESVLRIKWPKYWRFLASASILLMNIQDWSPLGWTGWISLQSKGLSRVFSNTTVQKHQFISAQLSLWSYSHICTWLLEEPVAFTLTYGMSICLYVLLAICILFVHRWPLLCCCCLVAKSCLTLCDPVDCSVPAPLSLTISQSLPKFKSFASVMPSNHLILCHPLLLLTSTFGHWQWIADSLEKTLTLGKIEGPPLYLYVKGPHGKNLH